MRTWWCACLMLCFASVAGSVRAQDWDSISSLAAGCASPDPVKQVAAVDRVSALLDEHPNDPELLKLFQNALATPGPARDAAARALCAMLGPSKPITAEIDKLIASPDPDTHVMGSVIASWRFWDPRDEYRAKAVTAQEIMQGVHHRLRWVRAVATDRMFRYPLQWPIDGKAILKEATWDPNPEVAWDANLRLKEALPLNLMNLTVRGFADTDEALAAHLPGIAYRWWHKVACQPVLLYGIPALVALIGVALVASRRRSRNRAEAESLEV